MAIFSGNAFPEVLFTKTGRRMSILHHASLPRAQRGIVGINHTTHLDLLSNALEVSDTLFKSLENTWSTFILILIRVAEIAKGPTNGQIVHFGQNRHSRVNSDSPAPTARQPPSARARPALLPRTCRTPAAHISRAVAGFRPPACPCVHQPCSDVPLACMHAYPCTSTLPRRPYIRANIPNVHSSVQPSHPTLKHFPDSFLVSRG
ncbi:hypothetical protein CRG98_000677 [Punica granatum]|uniref:Uncharacterized protein n=1 Tax=Punica granatum TaxID=22663 RepID=A0A2I0LE40_PUNGR|nr:hypothetical protein CRG98_000677 [Punica granatum]